MPTKPNTQAALWMTTSIVLSSWWPLTVATFGNTTDPFTFTFWAAGISILVWLTTIPLIKPNLLKHKTLWADSCRNMFTLPGLLAIFNGFHPLFFIAATHFVDTALATIISSGWLIMFVALQKRHDNRSRYTQLTPQGWAIMTVALAGIALVTLSQTGGLQLNKDITPLWGFLLAIISAIALACISHRLATGTTLYHQHLPNNTRPGPEVACQLVVTIIASIPAAVTGLIVGVTLNTTTTQTHPQTVLIVSAVIVAMTVGSVAFRYANSTTNNLGINALQYLRPVLALTWLSIFATITVHRTDWLTLGAAAVIAANTLISAPNRPDTNTQTEKTQPKKKLSTPHLLKIT